MMISIATAALMASGPEPIKLRISRLFGGPSSIDQALTVKCAANTYSFKHSINQKFGETMEFNREPKPAPAELSAAMIDVLSKFAGVPSIEPWCASPSDDAPEGILSLEIYGSISVNDRGARSDCVKREGIYDPKSLWIVYIDGDDLRLVRDELGQCTTKQDIDEFRQRTKGSGK